MTGRVYGTAGHIPARVGRASAVRAGAAAERRVEAVLNAAAIDTGFTVLHDLTIPDSRGANIDHVLISGHRVLLIDTKTWAPGFYWTWAGKTKNWRKRAEHCEKQTLPFAKDRLSALFASHAVRATFVRPVIALVPTRDGSTPAMWAARLPGSPECVALDALARAVRRYRSEADDAVVRTLLPLVRHLPAAA